MLSLKDISTYKLRILDGSGQKVDLYNMGIRTAADLEGAINEGRIRSYIALDYLKKCYSLISRHERGTAHLDINRFKSYEESPYDQEQLRQVDINTPVTELMLDNLFFEQAHRGYLQIREFNVDLVKHLASHTNAKNCLLIETFYYLGEARSNHIIEALKQYEAQVLRTAATINGDLPDNLFFLFREEKTAIVRSHLHDYFQFMFNRSNDFIFGSLTDRQIYLLMSPTKEQHVNLARERIINDLASYTTLEELDTNEVPELALSRFIR